MSKTMVWAILLVVGGLAAVAIVSHFGLVKAATFWTGG